MSKLQSASKHKIRTHLSCSQLPLAVYREVSAHLRQLPEVDAGLIVKSSTASDNQQFDYGESQIEALWLEYPKDLDGKEKQRIDEILDYYGKRYHPWEKGFD